MARAEGQRPSVAERVRAVADVEKGRAREERHAQERARSTPDYSYDHSYEHHHHRGTHQEPRGISMGR